MFYPYTHLFVGPKCTTVSLGPHIVVLDTLYVSYCPHTAFYSPIDRTGAVLASTYSFKAETKIDDEDVSKSGPVRCLDVDSGGKHFASVGDDKILKIWELVEKDSEVDGVLQLKLINRRLSDTYQF